MVPGHKGGNNAPLSFDGGRDSDDGRGGDRAGGHGNRAGEFATSDRCRRLFWVELDNDDRVFEVDDTTCSDGRKYDLKFDARFRLVRKKLDD